MIFFVAPCRLVFYSCQVAVTCQEQGVVLACLGVGASKLALTVAFSQLQLLSTQFEIATRK